MPAPTHRPLGLRRRSATLAIAGVATLLGLSVAFAAAQDDAARSARGAQPQTDALVNRVLDAPVKLNLIDRPLPEVLDAISDVSGVPFRVEESTYALLPYGRDTPISVTVTSRPLRETLELISQRLALEFKLGEETVELRPLPPLARSGRRATVEEVAMLDLLAGVRLDLIDDRPTAAQLLEAVDLKLQDLDAAAEQAGQPVPGYVVENRLDDLMRDRRVFVARDATLADAMESIHEQTGGTWYPWGDTLAVVAKDVWVNRMLDRRVTLSYDRVELPTVIKELQEATGVAFRVEPGTLQRVPEQFRRVRFNSENGTVRDALESLAAVTGVGYAVAEDGVYLGYREEEEAGFGGNLQRGNGSGGRPILSVDLGDGTALLLYESDLPADVRDRLLQRRDEEIRRLVEQLDQPTDTPASTPTSAGD